jgi:hypothetical protein
MEPLQAANALHDLIARAPVADRQSVNSPLKLVGSRHDPLHRDFLSPSEIGRLLKNARGGRWTRHCLRICCFGLTGGLRAKNSRPGMSPMDRLD